MLEANCYLLKCDAVGHAVVIDPGDDADRIAGEIREMKLEPEAILLTHGHIDHANAASDLRREFRCRVICHGEDRRMVEAGEALSLWGLKRNPCPVDQEIADADTIAVGDQVIQVIHTPGHTRGSVCFKVGSHLFSGDVIFKGSIGRTDLPGGSDEEMMKTLKTRIATLESATRVYPGHGPLTTIAQEQRFNPFL
jgi:hydroxyacylglutathione hydrolase